MAVKLEDTLFELLADSTSMPFLFVGSGLSRRYIGLDDWESLLRRFAANVDNSYEYYQGKGGGEPPVIASLIAEDFYDKWWKGPAFQERVAKFRKDCSTKCFPLKVEISNFLMGIETHVSVDPRLQDEYDLLRNAKVDGVITTNWDLLLEELFPDFKTLIGQKSILTSEQFKVAEIYKIHGCCTMPGTLVLTEEDYSRFEDRYPYLAAKLITIFVEHPVIFLGYSLRDDNIQRIVSEIAGCLSGDELAVFRDRLIFVEWNSSCTTPSIKHSVINVGQTSVPITLIETDSFVPVFSPLAKLERKFPAPLLRKLKEHIYDLVKENDPKSKMYVSDLDGQDVAQVDVVFGVGAISALQSQGYITYDRDDIVKDVLCDGNSLDAALVLEHVLPQILKSTKWVCCFKYLHAAVTEGFDVGELLRKPTYARLVQRFRFESARYVSSSYVGKARRINATWGSLEAMIEGLSPKQVFYQAPALDLEKVELDVLRRFLDTCYDSGEYGKDSDFHRLVCFYDYLKYWLTLPEGVRSRIAGSESKTNSRRQARASAG